MYADCGGHMEIPHFPYETYRPGQKEAILFILDAFANGKKFVLLEAPTGAGKSAIAYTVARTFMNSYYLTATKILQTQLMRDFRHTKKLEVLKGRSNYTCKKWAEVITQASDGENPIRQTLISQLAKPEFNFNCNVGVCKLRYKKSSLPECIGSQNISCEYWRQIDAAKRAQICVMNFDSFLYQTVYTKSFEERSLLVADECHNVEEKLLNFASLSISDKLLDFSFKQQQDPQKYYEYFRAKKLSEKIKQMWTMAEMADDIKLAEKYESLHSKLAIFISDCELYPDQINKRWVCNFIKKPEKHPKLRIVELKPLFVRDYAQKLVFNMANRVLMMSATILSPATVMDSLGIDPKDAAFHRMPSSFPPEKRKIVLEPVGSLSWKNKHDSYPKLIETVDKICGDHPDHKGIIHTHNFEIANLLIDECDCAGRFLFQKDFTSKTKMLDTHAKNQNSVIVAPAMHEGIDLVDNLSRFQIICKVPYPNQNSNPQLKARAKLSWNYYLWLTALKMVQSYGRSVRHDEDWATTYIVDTDFSRFLEMTINMLPDWFLEAIE
jgi:ATP-dependent DNA helicase DinG